MRVIKRDGRIVKYNPDKIVNAITKAMVAVGEVDKDLAVKIASAVTDSFNSDKEVSVEDIQNRVEDNLIKFGSSKLAKAYILYRADRAQIRGFRQAIGVEDDLKLGINALSLLDKRYLKKIDDKKETPSQMFRRVAKAISSAEKRYGSNPEHWEKAFYNLMANRYFLPSTPALANAGNSDGLCLFACFGFEIQDSMEDILQCAKDSGMVQKSGGGVGLHLSKLRPSNDYVRSTNGVASGPISFMRIFDIISDVTKQGGIRRGGNLGLLLVSHPDIESYIHCKSDEHTLNNFNISVAITDEFMRAVKNGSDFMLVNPKNNKPVRKVDARGLFRSIAEAAWRNGEPGVVFWDTLQKDNPTPSFGNLIVNLCSEQPLLDKEACCLGSINLEKFVDDDGKIVYNSLRRVVNHAVRFLDDVLDVSYYPLDKIKDICLGNRKIGLGVMGFANMLIRLEVPYDSDKALEVAEEVMDFINVESRKASAKLADERGDFPNIAKSKVPPPQRNATLTTIAPTGSISIIAETSSGIEPLFAVVYQRTNILEENTFFEVNSIFEEVSKREGWYKPELISKIIKLEGKVTGLSDVPEKWQRVFRTALEISPEWHVKMQAAFQRHTNNAISKTINLPFEATIDDVEKAIKLGYDMNLKGLTVFRNNSRSKQVLQCIECEEGACNINDAPNREV